MGLRQRGGSGKRSRGRRNAVDSSGPSRLIDSAQPDRTGYSRGPARAVHVAPSVVESAADLQVSAIAGPQSRPRAELALCRTTGCRVQGRTRPSFIWRSVVSIANGVQSMWRPHGELPGATVVP